MPKRRQPVYTLKQEQQIKRIANKVFTEQFKDKGVKKPQVKMGLALGNMSQSSVSAMLAGTYTPAPHFAENLATLAGYESLRDMIGPFSHPAADDDEDTGTGTAPGNLRRCLEFHGPGRWQPWTIAAASSGLFTDDVTPAEWVARLDDLEKTLAKKK